MQLIPPTNLFNASVQCSSEYGDNNLIGFINKYRSHIISLWVPNKVIIIIDVSLLWLRQKC